MDALDSVLPVYVDYLGRYEQSATLHAPKEVLIELMNKGVQKRYFLPSAEVTIGSGMLTLRDSNDASHVEQFELRYIRDPVAFVAPNKQQTGSGFTRVVILTELGGGHNNKNMFHAFQCLDSDPRQLVENIKRSSSTGMSYERYTSQNSLDNNWLNNESPEPPRQERPLSNTGNFLLGQPRDQYKITDDPIQRFTILLNYCIGDIERFCADVRAVKAKRKEGRSHVPIHEELRATDFIGIFQKFKLGFNLVAYLQGHLHDPSADDLLHHMFPPLAFLVDECYDTFDEDLVRDVVAPLPTTKCVVMMSKSLSAREIVIWKALGDCWQTPRKSYGREVLPYRPIFQDGWSPGYVHIPDDDDDDLARNKPQPPKKEEPVNHIPPEDYFRTSTFDDFRDQLMQAKKRIALVTFSRERNNGRELTVAKGEYLEVLDDEKQWWKCRNKGGEVGYVPHTILKAIIYQDKFDYSDFNAPRRTPSRRSQRRPPSPSSSERSASPAPSIPPPAPPMPRQSSMKKPHPLVRDPSMGNMSIRSTDTMQEELKNVLDLYREKEKHLEIKTTPDVYITGKSTPTEVRNWLKDKKFSQRALDQLGSMNGNQVFAMSRKDLISAFGKTEGTRLDSQITLSRNNSGFKTARSSELKEILAKARQKSEKKRRDGEEEEDDDADLRDEYGFSKA